MTKLISKLSMGIILLIIYTITHAQSPGYNDAVYSGILWFHDLGLIVSVHAANIIKDKT